MRPRPRCWPRLPPARPRTWSPINLAAGAENELVARAREVAEDAADSARFVLDS